MTKRDDDAIGETVAGSEHFATGSNEGNAATITPSMAMESGETLTPTQAIGISETIAPAEALASSETITPEQARASNSRDALESSETITPAEAASSTQSVNRRARPGPESLPEIARSTYAVRNELARGGMGRILVADDSRLGRRVAIKELITNNRGLQRRFAREVRITARLQHPGIVPVYEAGHWPDGEPFYAMKLVAGQSLEKVVETKPELEERLRLLPNLVGLTEAIAYAHGNGVIHRDLKPANVLVGDYGETVVIDWGLAKEVGDSEGDGDSMQPVVAAPGMTVHGAVVGTPAYMPPEQARGERVDARADVYSLGALMWHVLAGRPPYKGGVESVLAQVRDEPPPRLHDVMPGLPDELVSIVEHAMERDADLRYPTAGELAKELSRFQTGQLVTRHEYSAWQLFRRWVKRNRAVVAAVAALLVGGGIVGAVAFRQVMAERDRARAVSLAALEEQGRKELVDGHPLRASVFFAEAYRGGRSDEALRLMLGESMRAVDASIATWPAGTWITHVAWAGKDQLVAVGDDGAVTLWNLTTNTRDVIAPASMRPRAVAISEDGKHFALLGDRALNIIDLTTRAVATVKLGGFPVGGVAIVKDVVALQGERSTSWFGLDGTARPTANVPVRVFPSQDMWVAGDLTIQMPQTPDQQPDPAPHVFQIIGDEGVVLREIGRVDEHETYSTGALDQAGRRFAGGTQDGVVRIWDVPTGLPLASFDGHTRNVRSLAFDPSGTRLASTGDDGVVRVWALDAPLFTLPAPTERELAPAAGAVHATAHFNEVVVGTHVMRGLEELVSWVDTSADGATVVAGARDGRVIRWEVATGRAVGTWELGSTITAGDLARDGTIAVGTRDGGARIIRGGADLVKLEGHATAVHSLAWHPTRPELLSAADSAVRVWNEQGKLLRYLSAGEPIAQAWWSKDGQWILVDGESALQVWDGVHGTLLMRVDHAVSPLEINPTGGPRYGARDDAGVTERLAAIGGFVPWPLPRETRPAAAVKASVVDRVPWLLSGGELVPAHALVAVRSEDLQQTTTTYDFSGETISTAPSKPALPLGLSVPAVSNALRILATGDAAGARSALASVTDTQDPQTAYDVAWCWHFIGDEQAAYGMGIRAWTLWPDASTKPRVLADVFRFAAWGDVGHATIVSALGDAADNKTRLELAETYDQLGHVTLVTPTVESMKITDDWQTRLRGLYLLASRSYLRGDLMTAAEHLDVAARAIPTDKVPALVLDQAQQGGPACGKESFRPTSLDVAADPATAIATLTRSLAYDSYRTFMRTYDHRFALVSRRLFALLARFGVPKTDIDLCGAELDQIAERALGRAGSFDKTIIRSEFDDQHTALVACYQRAVDSDASIVGRVMVNLEISSTGKITRVDTAAEPDTRGMQSLATCVQTAISHFDFPRQQYAGNTLVDYPLEFKRP